MNKKSQYKAFEWQIIIGITLILLTGILIIKDKGITGYATKETPKTIEINQILIPQQTTEPTIEQTKEEPTTEKPIQTQEEYNTQYYLVSESFNNLTFDDPNTGIQFDSNNTFAFNFSNVSFEGFYSGRFMSSCNDNLVGGGLRTEMYNYDTVYSDEVWVGFNVMVPELWDTSSYFWNILFQFHATEDPGEAAISPPFSIGINSRKWVVDLRNSSIKIITGNNPDNRTAFSFNISDVVPNQWVSWVVHIKWSPSDDGIVEVWKDGELVVSRINMPIGYNDTYYPYLKFGIYRINGTSYCNKTVYHDYLKVTNSNGSYFAVEPPPLYINNTPIEYNHSKYYRNVNITSNTTNMKIIPYKNIQINITNITHPYNDIKNISNNIILASNVNNYTIELQPNQTIEIGNFVEDEDNNSVPVVDSIILFDDLTCVVNASDVDNDSLSYIIEWYYNGTLNKTSNNSVDTQELFVGEHYCRARVYDGFNFSDWNYSNIIIIYPNNSINLSNSLNCYGYINNTDNLTFYLNNNPNFTIEVNGSFNVSINISEGLWYCSVGSLISNNVSITINTSISVNTPVNTAPKTTSGGSGGGFIVIPNNYTNSSNLSNKIDLNNNSNLSNYTSSNNSLTVDQSLIVEIPVNQKISEPIIESPDIVGKAYISINNKYPLIGFFIILLVIIFIAYKNKPVHNPSIESFTVKALNSGYSYNAIRHVLKKYYPDHVIDDHFHILRRKNYSTVKQSLKNISLTQKNIIILNNYILRQRNNGFKDKDIKTALKNFGYPKNLIDASFNYKNN
ncbi:MAG: polysaccharide lyase [Candidatus Woesearchaeota archaeon]